LWCRVGRHLIGHIRENIGVGGNCDTTPGSGLAFEMDVEDAVGVGHQIETLTEVVEEKI